jgi:hypothetical protein
VRAFATAVADQKAGDDHPQARVADPHLFSAPFTDSR